MAIAVKPIFTDDQVVHLKVPRNVYETLVENLGDDSHVRLTYDGELLEIMSPGILHDFQWRRLSAAAVQIAGGKTANVGHRFKQ